MQGGGWKELVRCHSKELHKLLDRGSSGSRPQHIQFATHGHCAVTDALALFPKARSHRGNLTLKRAGGRLSRPTVDWDTS